MPDEIEILLLAIGSFSTLFIIAKLLGKKQVGELDFIDYVVGISIGSIAAEMATNTSDKPFYYYLISMSVFFLLTLSVDILGTKANFLKKFFKGSPMVIIKDGVIDFKQLKKSKLDINDVTALARSKGYFNFDDIAYAIFETDGSLSILPKSEQKPVVCEDLKIKSEKATLPQNVIVDGEVSQFALKEMGKDIAWLYHKLNINSKKDLKNILLAIYTQSDGSFVVHLKNEK
ncbi:MAG: DUF421 domain-containing protein [Christensenellales bacterium]